MDDLIARNRLLTKIREVYEYEFPTASGDFDRFVTKILPNIICNQPTVDAVPVVRCKDCEFAEHDTKYLIKENLYYCVWHEVDHNPNYYCVIGERKDDEENGKCEKV